MFQVAGWSGDLPRGRRACSSARSGTSAEKSGGYAAVDALIAMFILGSTVVFSIAAAQQGMRAAALAREIREADLLTQSILANTTGTTASTTGRRSGFAWSLDVGEPLHSYGAAALCTHKVTMQSVTSRRTYVTATDEVCASGAAT